MATMQTLRRTIPRLHVRHVRSRDAPESLFIELWTLRRGLITVKPEVTAEADYAAFRSFFADEDARISLVSGEDGAVHGFLGWHMRPLTAPAVRVVVVDSDYYFIKESLRGNAILIQVALDFYARSAVRYLWPHVVIVGHGYPLFRPLRRPVFRPCPVPSRCGRSLRTRGASLARRGRGSSSADSKGTTPAGPKAGAFLI